MIEIELKNFERIVRMFDTLEGLSAYIGEVVTSELWEYAKVLHSDPSIPEEYRESLSLTVVPEFDAVALYAYQPKKYKKFGNRLQWAVYRCPRRKYFGGKLTPEYDGPSYIKERWKSYQNVFMSRVRQRIVDYLKTR